jgi:hypothetical protein
MMYVYVALGSAEGSVYNVAKTDFKKRAAMKDPVRRMLESANRRKSQH